MGNKLRDVYNTFPYIIPIHTTDTMWSSMVWVDCSFAQMLYFLPI